MLTPLFASTLGMTTAVAAVAIPHAFATGVRCWRLRRNIDWAVARNFGVLSAIGGITGALLYTRIGNRTLTLILAVLLIATGVAGLTDWTRRFQVGSRTAGLLGVASGLFGGLAGNQGGLRAAALFAFSLAPAAFVATSTAVGLAVDAARMPIYVWRAGGTLLPHAAAIAVACAGVLIGTLLGERVLLGMAPDRFKRVVSALIGLLGLWLLAVELIGFSVSMK